VALRNPRELILCGRIGTRFSQIFHSFWAGGRRGRGTEQGCGAGRSVRKSGRGKRRRNRKIAGTKPGSHWKQRTGGRGGARMRRGAGVPPAVARAFLRSAQDRLCPRDRAMAAAWAGSRLQSTSRTD